MFKKFNFVYNILFVTGKEKTDELSNFKIKCKNLIIYYIGDNFNTQKYCNFSKKLENLIIYNFWPYDELNNLPMNLKNLVIYDNLLDFQNIKDKKNIKYNTYKNAAEQKYLQIKIPLNCKFILNNIIQQ